MDEQLGAILTLKMSLNYKTNEKIITLMRHISAVSVMFQNFMAFANLWKFGVVSKISTNANFK